jgi:large subunit ribosomal protein L24
MGSRRSRDNALLKVGDKVQVIAGGNKATRPLKGQVGTILRFVGDNLDRVVVQGLNLVSRHQRARRPGEESGIVKKEASIHLSNVMYYSESLKRPVRLCKSGSPSDGFKRGFKDPGTGEFQAI